MDPAVVIRRVRGAAGLSLRALAGRAETSHSTLAAYESGRVHPSVATLERIVRAAGFQLMPTLTRAVAASDADRSRELVEVLELAALFPARHSQALECPIFAASATAS